MEEKIIREKNRTSMKKIANDDRLRLRQMRLETRDSRLKSIRQILKEQKKVEAVVLWSRGVRAGLLGEEERNEIKTKFFTN